MAVPRAVVALDGSLAWGDFQARGDTPVRDDSAQPDDSSVPCAFPVPGDSLARDDTPELDDPVQPADSLALGDSRRSIGMSLGLSLDLTPGHRHDWSR